SLRNYRSVSVLLILAFACFGPANAASSATPSAAELPAFPGALGWAAHTPGGRGGKIIRVTTLAARGPGSFLEAVEMRGPRIVVFEVGGIIDLERHEI